MTTTLPLQLWRVETLRPISTKDEKTIITHVTWRTSDESAKSYADEVVRKGGKLVAITKYVNHEAVFHVFEVLDRLLADGHTIDRDDKHCWLKDRKGKKVMTGHTDRDLCLNIVLAGL